MGKNGAFRKRIAAAGARGLKSRVSVSAGLSAQRGPKKPPGSDPDEGGVQMQIGGLARDPGRPGLAYHSKGHRNARLGQGRRERRLQVLPLRGDGDIPPRVSSRGDPALCDVRQRVGCGIESLLGDEDLELEPALRELLQASVAAGGKGDRPAHAEDVKLDWAGEQHVDRLIRRHDGPQLHEGGSPRGFVSRHDLVQAHEAGMPPAPVRKRKCFDAFGSPHRDRTHVAMAGRTPRALGRGSRPDLSAG